MEDDEIGGEYTAPQEREPWTRRDQPDYVEDMAKEVESRSDSEELDPDALDALNEQRDEDDSLSEGDV